MQDTPDGVGADRRQPVRGTTQCSLQRRERPGRRLVFVPIRLSAEFLQDTLLLPSRIPLGLAAPMPLDQRIEPIPIETCDQVGDSIPTLPPSGTGRCLKAGSTGNREQFLGSCDPGGWSSMRSAHLLKRQAFFGREGTKGIFLTSGHGKLRGGETTTICS